MLAGKTLVGFTSMFSLYDWKKWPHNFELFQRWINAIPLKLVKQTDQTKFRLNEIAKIENYFNQEMNQRK